MRKRCRKSTIKKFWIMIDKTFIGAILGGAISAAVQGGPRRQYKWNKRAASDANEMNRANQQWLLEQQKSIQAEQRAYDSPQAQMERYIAAGLNPHLIYGTGSSAGQAFAMNAPGMPAVNIQAPSAAYPNPVPSFIGASQALAGVGLTEAKTEESIAKQALIQIQTEIAKTNPMLSPSVASWVAASMQETARLKTMESRTWLAQEHDVMRISAKVNAELDALVQRVGLNTADLAIKNKILESKEFENVIKEVQAKFLKDADVSPEHIRQFMMLLLSKMLGR